MIPIFRDVVTLTILQRQTVVLTFLIAPSVVLVILGGLELLILPCNVGKLDIE
jgi:hypothetical protein